MSKRSNGRNPVLAVLLAAGTAYLLSLPVLMAQGAGPRSDSPSVATVADAQVERAKADLERTERLVADGTLPRAKLDEARSHLADAEDEALLKRTLYGLRLAANMTEEEGAGMLAAAERRVGRAKTFFDDRQTLFASGAVAKVDVESAARELEDRERVLGFAKDRVRLLKELASMAESEREAAKSADAALKNSIIRSEGKGSFSLNDLTPIEAQFERTFHRALPISAMGQTLTHQTMGLDHRNRVDVALSPTQAEGVWLLALLDRLHVPYLAFRNAVAGAATAPHIHIGLGSTRLQAGFRPAGN